MAELLEKIRLKLAGFNAQPLLALLGLISGLLAGITIILFRKIIEITQTSLLPGGSPEGFEGLSLMWRFLLPFSGGVILAIFLTLFSQPSYRFGVVHVMERLAYFEGYMPLRNAILQFVGAAVALITGQSVGREGPGAHLGAAASSQLGQYLSLPNNSIRTLVACGTAAAIAASFNTPLTGVIFAMEVVMMEYTIAGFTPVILAAVSATALTQWVYGSEAVFSVPPLQLLSVLELPVVLIMGILLGCLAAAFITLLQKTTEAGSDIAIWQKMLIAGSGVGLCAIFVPEIMGIGYDTVNKSISGSEGLGVLLVIVVVKLVATSISVGLGVPGGLIGPSLVMGATGGGLIGLLTDYLPGETSHPGLYAMLGMGAMMGACLQAPLTALVTLLELTSNPHIILPGMLAIVTANLTAKEVFSKDSVFLSQMRARGLDYQNDPISQSLRRLAVASVMDREFVKTERVIEREKTKQLLDVVPHWLIIECDGRKLLMPASDLARFLEENDDETIDLLEIPSNRLELGAVHLRATLQEAKVKLDESDAEALYVFRPTSQQVERIYGIIDYESINKGYRL